MPVSVAFSFSHTNNTYNTVMIFMLLKTETKQKVESKFFIIYFNLKETHKFSKLGTSIQNGAASAPRCQSYFRPTCSSASLKLSSTRLTTRRSAFRPMIPILHTWTQEFFFTEHLCDLKHIEQYLLSTFQAILVSVCYI